MIKVVLGTGGGHSPRHSELYERIHLDHEIVNQIEAQVRSEHNDRDEEMSYEHQDQDHSGE
jgi:hypothetical protein